MIWCDILWVQPKSLSTFQGIQHIPRNTGNIFVVCLRASHSLTRLLTPPHTTDHTLSQMSFSCECFPKFFLLLWRTVTISSFVCDEPKNSTSIIFNIHIFIKRSFPFFNYTLRTGTHWTWVVSFTHNTTHAHAHTNSHSHRHSHTCIFICKCNINSFHAHTRVIYIRTHTIIHNHTITYSDNHSHSHTLIRTIKEINHTWTHSSIIELTQSYCIWTEGFSW